MLPQKLDTHTHTHLDGLHEVGGKETLASVNLAFPPAIRVGLIKQVDDVTLIEAEVSFILTCVAKEEVRVAMSLLRLRALPW